MREINFGVVYWGAAYRRYFLDYCLPSLLAEGNLPALVGDTHRFLICTGAEDWAATRRHPAFRRLARYMPCEHVDFPVPDATEGKMRAMSRGHKALAGRMYARRALGSFVYPDTVYADGSLREIARLGAAGCPVVLALCPRFANAKFLDEVDALRGRQGSPAETLSLNPRHAVDLAIRHMHAETLSNEWTGARFGAKPTMAFWRVADGSGLLFHSLHWAPVLLDYGAINQHDTRTFEDWTIDADYVFRNFPDPRAVHVIDDSDQAMLVSFSPDDDPPPRHRIQRVPFVGELFKTLLLRRHLNSSRFDALKRALVTRPIRIHRDTIGPVWDDIEADAERRIAAALVPMTGFASRLLQLLTIADEGVPRHARLWLQRRRPPRPG